MAIETATAAPPRRPIDWNSLELIYCGKVNQVVQVVAKTWKSTFQKTN